MMLGVMRQEDLSGSALRGTDSLGPLDQKPKAQQCRVRDGLSNWPILVSCFHLDQRVSLGKSRHLSVSVGLSGSLVALCLFFCHTKEWKGVFPQPVRRPSLKALKPPHLNSAQRICVFSVFLLTGQGLPLSPGGEKSTCDTGSWQGLMVITR